MCHARRSARIPTRARQSSAAVRGAGGDGRGRGNRSVPLSALIREGETRWVVSDQSTRLGSSATLGVARDQRHTLRMSRFRIRAE